jgi:hypothetical protein
MDSAEALAVAGLLDGYRASIERFAQTIIEKCR